MRSAAALSLFVASFFASVPVVGHHGARHRHCVDCGDYNDCPSCDTPRRSRSTGATYRAVERAPRTESIQGTVTETIFLPGRAPADAIVEVLVRHESGTALVRLGPAGFLRENGVAVKEGDAIVVNGYTVSAADGDLFVAQELTRDGASVRIRDSRGRPLW